MPFALPASLPSALATRLPLSARERYKSLTQSLSHFAPSLVAPENAPPPEGLPPALRSLARAYRALLRGQHTDAATTVGDVITIHFDTDVGERALREITALPEKKGRRVDWEYGVRYLEKSRRELEEEDGLGGKEVCEELDLILENMREREEGRRGMETILESGAVGEVELEEIEEMSKAVNELLMESQEETKEERETRELTEYLEKGRKRVEAIERRVSRWERNKEYEGEL